MRCRETTELSREIHMKSMFVALWYRTNGMWTKATTRFEPEQQFEEAQNREVGFDALVQAHVRHMHHAKETYTAQNQHGREQKTTQEHQQQNGNKQNEQELKPNRDFVVNLHDSLSANELIRWSAYN